MAGAARRIPPKRPPGFIHENHVFDLYGVYISLMEAIADTDGSQRASAAHGRQVLHKVIHRLRVLRNHLRERAAGIARLAGRDARALEWWVRRHGERTAKRVVAVRRPKPDQDAGRRTRPFQPAACAPFPIEFSIARRIALMLIPRLAHDAFTSPRRPEPANGAQPVLAPRS